VDNSSLVRECDLVFLTRAGAEIGVASTKAFTTQLVALMILTIALGRRRSMSLERERELLASLQKLPDYVQQTLELNADIERLSEAFIPKRHALFLGRGIQYPIAMEGALKLKEISYIHAEGYAAGEMKHGPIALIDENMPVVVIANQSPVYDKVISNLEEVRAREGQVIALATEGDHKIDEKADAVIRVPQVSALLEPIVAAIPLQLLAYHIATLKGTDVDQPRNLAKSVTVE